MQKINYYSSSFSIFLNNITIVCNDEGTRTFICLEIDPNIHSSRVILNNLVQRINQCLDEFNLPPFYEVCTYANKVKNFNF